MSFLAQAKTDPKAAYRFLHRIAISALGLAALLVPLVVINATRDHIDLPKQLVFSGLILVAFLSWLLHGVLVREITIRRTNLDIPVLLLAIVFIISSFFSASATTSWVGRSSDFVLSTATLFSLLLWFWLLLQYIKTIQVWRRLISLFLFSGILAGVAFASQQIGYLRPFFDWTGFNMVSQLNSLLGIFLAIVGIIAIGLLLDNRRMPAIQILPAAAALMSLYVLCRLGFAVSWTIFAIGLGLLLVLGSMMVRSLRMWALSVAFAVFIVSIVFIFTGTPDLLKQNLPVELALGGQTSWSISTQAIGAGVKNFLLGEGPGMFSVAFSAYRPQAINTVPVAWSSRFHRPYNIFFSFLVESGLLGLLSFFFVILFQIGNILSAWIRTRSGEAVHLPEEELTSAFLGTDELHPMEVFAIAIAWFAATAALIVAFFTFTLWFAWWFLLAMSVLGLTVYLPIVREKVILLEVSPQYSLALSFGVILLCTGVLFYGIFAGKFYRAEVSFTKAANTTDPIAQEKWLDDALSYRPDDAEYRLALASYYFNQAKSESDKPNPSAELIANRLAAAVNAARMAADTEPNSVETWETLSLMYLNARVFASESNNWAREALDKAIALEPTNPIFIMQRGSVEEFANNFDGAEKFYKQSISLKSDYLPGYVQLSALYERQNKLDQAIAVFQPISTLVAQNPEMLFDLGRLLYNRNGPGDTDKAEQVWLQSVALSPNYSNALYSLGLLYEQRRGNRAKALEYYRQVQALNPGNTDVAKKISSLVNGVPAK